MTTAPTSDIPDVCFIEDLVTHLRLSLRSLSRLRRAGTFPIPELPRLDGRPRWSGAAVQRFLQTGQTGQRLLRRVAS